MSFFPVSDCTGKGENGEKWLSLGSVGNLCRVPSVGAPRAAVRWWGSEAKGWEMRQKGGN